MSTTVDVVASILVLLKRDADLMELTKGRIYGCEMPKEEIGHQPRCAVVIRRSPGLGSFGGFLELEKASMNMFTYGESHARAEAVRREVSRVLKQATRQVINEVLLHSFSPVGSPSASRDPDTDWPYTLSQWNFMAAEINAQ